MHSEEIKELAVSLIAAQAEFDTVSKDSTNPFFKSKYASLPEVMKTAGPVLSKHGLTISQHLGHDGEVDTLTTWLIHRSGQYIKDTMRLHLDKNNAQGQGSATTYARRYSYMAVLGLVADEDDDGNAASKLKGTQTETAISKVYRTPEKPDMARKASTSPFIPPSLMNDLKQTFMDAQITGQAAAEFAMGIIGTPAPHNEGEAYRLIAAVKELTP